MLGWVRAAEQKAVEKAQSYCHLAVGAYHEHTREKEQYKNKSNLKKKNPPQTPQSYMSTKTH